MSKATEVLELIENEKFDTWDLTGFRMQGRAELKKLDAAPRQLKEFDKLANSLIDLFSSVKRINLQRRSRKA